MHVARLIKKKFISSKSNKERDRETERQRDRDREIDREIDRETETETETETFHLIKYRYDLINKPVYSSKTDNFRIPR